MQIYANYIDKSKGKIQLWDFESGTRIATPDATKFTSVTFFPSKVPSPDILGEIVLGRQDGHIEYWQIKKTDTSVEFKKKSEAKKNLTTGSVDAIIYTPSSYYSEKGIFLARVRFYKGNAILKFEVKNNTNSDVNILKETSTSSWVGTSQFCTGLAFAIFPDNKHILSQIGNSLCLWNSNSHISDWAPRREKFFDIDPNVDKVPLPIPNNYCLNTIAILNKDMIFTGWNDGKIKIWSSRSNYPLGRSTLSWFDSFLPDRSIKNIQAFNHDPAGDQYIEKIDGKVPRKGGMKKSKRVYKRSNRIVNKTRGRKK
jgi:hypothetical protein